MSAETKSSNKWTHRMLGIFALLSVAAGGTVYWSYDRHQQRLVLLETSKSDYQKIKGWIPEIRRLGEEEKKLALNPKQSDSPATYLGRTFTSQGFKETSFKTSPEARVTTLGVWKEREVQISFDRIENSAVERSRLINVLNRIEKERPDLKTKELDLKFMGNDFQSARIQFSHLERQTP